jgi:hypothetical protein
MPSPEHARLPFGAAPPFLLPTSGFPIYSIIMYLPKIFFCRMQGQIRGKQAGRVYEEFASSGRTRGGTNLISDQEFKMYLLQQLEFLCCKDTTQIYKVLLP